jgi:hypothetical protein
VRHGPLPLPVGRFARLLARHGVPVHIWTVNDAAAARVLWGLGVRGIVSDDPATILAARAARMEGSDARASALDARLVAAEPAERSAALPEYALHRNDIDRALASARAASK